MGSFENLFGKTAQLQVLENILNNRGNTTFLFGIAEETGLSHSSVSRVIGPLIKLGIVKEQKVGKFFRTFALDEENELTRKLLKFQDETGQVVEAFSVACDITEHKRTEKSVLESEEKFKAISSSAKDAIIMMDNEGNISYWNEAAEKIFGYSALEALGKELHIFLAPKKYHDSYRRGILIFKATGCGPVIGKTLELEAVRKDGTGFPIEISVSAVKIEEKWHAIGIVRDITQRKKAEEERETLIKELRDVLTERKKAQQELEETIKRLEVYTTRVNSLMVTMLGQATDKKTNVVILDISGVAVDVEITEPLVNIARLSRLLGATCIVTGIKSEAVRKLADLGITLAPITTDQSLHDGLRYTIAMIDEEE